MSIVRDVPVGIPRAWTFAVEVTSLGRDSWEIGNGGGGLHFETRGGPRTQIHSATVTLQDVLRYEMIRVNGTDQLNVRHTRVAVNPATGARTDYDASNADNYALRVDVAYKVVDFIAPGVPNGTTAVARSTARVVAYGPDGLTIGSVALDPYYRPDFGTSVIQSGDDGFSHLYLFKRVLDLRALTDLAINIEARRWPGGEPIPGLPVTVTPAFSLPGQTQTYPYAPVTTDVLGNATLHTASPPPGWPASLALWQGANTAPLGARAKTMALGPDGRVHNEQPYADSTLRGYDDAGYFELLRSAALVRFARASSYIADDGSAPGGWVRSGDGKALARGLNPAQGQAARQYRYMRLRLRASAPCAATVTLSTDWANPDPGAGEPPVSSRSGTSYLPVVAGDNTFEVDLVSISASPFGAYGDFYRQKRGWIEGGSTWNLVLPDARKSTDGGAWDGHNPNIVTLSGLTPGANYTVLEVTFFDKGGPGRTPLRVLGSPMPQPGGVPFSTIGGQEAYINADGGICRILANGRLVASAPASFLNAAENVYASGPGSALLSTRILSVADLMDRWREYFDGGSGVWTLATDNAPLAAVFPQVAMEPSGVTGGGFALDAVAAFPTLSVAPGFDVTVSPSVTLRFRQGGVVEGLLFDDSSRRTGEGKSVRSVIQQPPPGDALAPPGPSVEMVATADADGYFAFRGLIQPQYWPNTFALQQRYDPGSAARGFVLPYKTRHQIWADDDAPVPGKAESSAGRPYVGPSDPGDPWLVVVGHRNSAYFYDLARFLRALAEQDFAQDHATGRLYRVWSDAATGALTAEAREGWLGLSGAPVRAAAPIIDTGGVPRPGANPSLWITHETGACSLVYAQGDASGSLVRALSDDHLVTLGAETMTPFTRAGGYPDHFQDRSTGVWYLFCAFDNSDGTQEIRAARQDAALVTLPWADGTTEKTVAASLDPAGRPRALPNRFDAVQTVLLVHGDRRFQSRDGGETWTALA